jgi:hypothetical protein
MNDSVRMDTPKMIPTTDDRFMIKIKSVKGKKINSVPSPRNVQPSTFLTSGNRFNFLNIMGIAIRNDKIIIEISKIF